MANSPEIIGDMKCDVEILSDCAGMSSETWGLKLLGHKSIANKCCHC